jgi:broad specificity phosphatase PhoE
MALPYRLIFSIICYSMRPIIEGTRFIFLRHGQSSANVEGIIAGVSDVPLSPLGEQQARDVRPKVAELGHLTHVFSSDLRRASRTAHLVTGRVPVTDRLLREQDFGTLELGKVTPGLREYLALPPTESRDIEVAPGAETGTNVLNRWDRFIDTNGDVLTQGATFIGSHGQYMRVILGVAGLERGARIRKLENTAIMVIEATGNPRTPDLHLVYSDGIQIEQASQKIP